MNGTKKGDTTFIFSSNISESDAEYMLNLMKDTQIEAIKNTKLTYAVGDRVKILPQADECGIRAKHVNSLGTITDIAYVLEGYYVELDSGEEFLMTPASIKKIGGTKNASFR